MRTTDTIKTSGAGTQLSPGIHQLAPERIMLSATQTQQGKVEPIIGRLGVTEGSLSLVTERFSCGQRQAGMTLQIS